MVFRRWSRAMRVSRRERLVYAVELSSKLQIGRVSRVRQVSREKALCLAVGLGQYKYLTKGPKGGPASDVL
jgi:hypothetical protein